MEVVMKKTLLAGVAVLAIAGTTAVYAQHRGFDGPGRHHQQTVRPSWIRASPP
jgi:hypothetical protein